jgi:N-methylhydantoinase A
MSDRIARRIAAHGLAVSAFQLSADMRYVGMGTELNVALPAAAATAANVAELFEGFHRQHHAVFGYAYRGRHAIETVALRVTAVARRDIAMPAYAFDGAVPTPAPVAMRRAMLAPDGTFADIAVYRRTELPRGWRAPGPLLIDQYDSTTVVLPGHAVVVDGQGNLIMTRG